jgi:bisphosphoglycerate-dependent phosphoglycerate mutase
MHGALQGKNKSETAAKYGEDQVKVSFDDKRNKFFVHFVFV